MKFKLIRGTRGILSGLIIKDLESSDIIKCHEILGIRKVFNNHDFWIQLYFVITTPSSLRNR